MIWFYNYGSMGFFGWFFMLIFWILVIWLIVWFANKSKTVSSDKQTNPNSNKTAIEILDERYARGEISKKEYDEKKRDIKKYRTL